MEQLWGHTSDAQQGCQGLRRGLWGKRHCPLVACSWDCKSACSEALWGLQGIHIVRCKFGFTSAFTSVWQGVFACLPCKLQLSILCLDLQFLISSAPKPVNNCSLLRCLGLGEGWSERSSDFLYHSRLSLELTAP